MIMEDMTLALKQMEECPVRGHLKMIDDTRLVFIGEDPAQPDSVCIGFRSAEGKDTSIKLSLEAYDALKYLMNEPFKGKRVGFPYKLSWQYEVKIEGE